MKLIKLFLLLLLSSGCVKSQPLKVVPIKKSSTPVGTKNTYNLNFAYRTDVKNTSQTFTPVTADAAWGHTGLDLIPVTAGQAVRVYSQYTGSDCINFILGFNTTNAQTGYTGMENAINITSGGGIYSYQNSGFFDSGITLSTGEWSGIFCEGGVMKLQKSTDGTTWTDLKVYRGYYVLTYTSALYITVDIHGTGKMVNPKVDLYGNYAQNLFVQDGNSLGQGQLDPGNYSTSNIGQQGWISVDGSHNFTYINKCVGGRGFPQNTSDYEANIVPLFHASYQKIIVAEIEGTNTLTGHSGSDAYDSMMRYVSVVLASDPRVRLVVYMCPSANTSYFTNAERVIYNDLLAGTTQTSRLKIVDIRSTSALNDALAWQNSTYYQSDGVHLKQAGYDLLYSLADPVIKSFGFEKQFAVVILLAAAATRIERKYKQAA